MKIYFLRLQVGAFIYPNVSKENGDCGAEITPANKIYMINQINGKQENAALAKQMELPASRLVR